MYCVVFVGIRLFCYETSAYNHCRTINATRPVMVLVGAMLVFGERLNVWQWIGVLLAIVSFFLLSRSGKKEGVNFTHNRWIFFLVVAAVLGAVSGLYDSILWLRLRMGEWD